MIRWAGLLVLLSGCDCFSIWSVVDPVTNENCLSLQADAFVNQKFESKVNTHSYRLAVNGTVNVSGSCGVNTGDGNEQYIEVTFNPNGIINSPAEEMWILRMDFDRKEDGEVEIKDYSLNSQSRSWLFGSMSKLLRKPDNVSIALEKSANSGTYEMSLLDLPLQDDSSIEFHDFRLVAVENTAKNYESESAGKVKRDAVVKQWPTSSIDHSASCPLDRKGLGRATWALLHTMSVYYPEFPTEEKKKSTTTFITSLSETYPCGFCARDMADFVKNHPPKVENRNELANWICELHNKVNKKVHKPQFDCSKIFERWRDGWADGSCAVN